MPTDCLIVPGTIQYFVRFIHVNDQGRSFLTVTQDIYIMHLRVDSVYSLGL